MKTLLLLFFTTISVQTLFASELTMQILRAQEKALTLNEFKMVYEKRQHIKAVIKKNIKHSRTRALRTHSTLQPQSRDYLQSDTYNRFYPEHNLIENRRIHLKQLNNNGHMQSTPHHNTHKSSRVGP